KDMADTSKIKKQKQGESTIAHNKILIYADHVNTEEQLAYIQMNAIFHYPLVGYFLAFAIMHRIYLPLLNVAAEFSEFKFVSK
ncbi:hypothetical protein ACJX0J_038475, partial [Zea mays]